MSSRSRGPTRYPGVELGITDGLDGAGAAPAMASVGATGRTIRRMIDADKAILFIADTLPLGILLRFEAAVQRRPRFSPMVPPVSTRVLRRKIAGCGYGCG